MDEKREKFRSFFAVDITGAARKKLVKFIKQLKKDRRYHTIKWTKPENLHMTIRFLGNISEEQFAQITEKVGEAIQEMSPFSITFPELIIFPNSRKPIALALKPEPIAPLIKLNRLIEKSVADSDCGIKPEPRPFLPHLTLGKIKSRSAPKIEPIKLPNIKIKVNNVQIFRSDTSETGSVYTPLVCLPMTLWTTSYVIPRLDRGIQNFNEV